jgi:hypothetical protein
MMLDGDQLEAFRPLPKRATSCARRPAGHRAIGGQQRLQRLEDRLGARLVTRGSRKDVADARRPALLDEARAALASLRQAERIGRNIARGAAGPLRIGYVFSAAMSGTLARALRALRDALPDLDVRHRWKRRCSSTASFRRDRHRADPPQAVLPRRSLRAPSTANRWCWRWPTTIR